MYLDPQQGRVLANLSLPRSLMELARQIYADQHSPFDQTLSLADTANEVSLALTALTGAGLAKSIGVCATPEDAVSLVNADPDVPDLPTAKAAQFIDRLNGKDAYKLAEGELLYWTTAGFEALTT